MKKINLKGRQKMHSQHLKYFYPILFILFSQITPSTLYGKENQYPSELKLLVHGLKEFALGPSEHEEITSVIKNIDMNSSKIDLSLINSVVKLEIAQQILISSQSQEEKMTNRYVIDNQSIKEIQDVVAKKGHELNSFSRFVIEAIQSDIWIILDKSPENKKNFSQQENIKKAITPLYQKIMNFKGEEFNDFLKPIMIKILKKIDLNITLFLNFSRSHPASQPIPIAETLFSLWGQTNQTSSPLSTSSKKSQRVKAEELMDKIILINPTDDTQEENSNKYYWQSSDDLTTSNPPK